VHRLDLDDVRAVLGQEFGRIRSGEYPGEIQDPDAVQSRSTRVRRTASRLVITFEPRDRRIDLLRLAKSHGPPEGLERIADIADRTVGGVDVQEELAIQQLRIVQYVVRRGHGCPGQPFRPGRGRDLVRGTPGHERADDFVDVRAVLPAIGRVLPAILGQVGRFALLGHPGQEVVPHPVRSRVAAGHMAVLGGEHAMRDMAVHARRPARDRAGVDPRDRAGLQRRGHHLLDRDLHELADASPLPGDQSEHRGDGGMGAGQLPGLRPRRRLGRLAGCSPEPGHPAGRRGDHIVGQPGLARSPGPERRDDDMHHVLPVGAATIQCPKLIE
jgi:hypothetical protein